jgi:hypothetical protein
MTINKMVPKAPLGPYPQFRLCGHEGNAPTNSKIKMISSNVVIDIMPPFSS